MPHAGRAPVWGLFHFTPWSAAPPTNGIQNISMKNLQNDDDLDLDHVPVPHSNPPRRNSGETYHMAISDQRADADRLLVNLRCPVTEVVDGVSVVMDVANLPGIPSGAPRLSVGYGADGSEPLFQIYCADDHFVLILPRESMLRRDRLGRRSYEIYERVPGEQDEPLDCDGLEIGESNLTAGFGMRAGAVGPRMPFALAPVSPEDQARMERRRRKANKRTRSERRRRKEARRAAAKASVRAAKAAQQQASK